MIAVTQENGNLVRVLPSKKSTVLGFHPSIGFTSDVSGKQRLRIRKKSGLKDQERAWDYRFELRSEGTGWSIAALENCQAKNVSTNRWEVQTKTGRLLVSETDDAKIVHLTPSENEETGWKAGIVAGLVPLLILVLLTLVKGSEPVVVQPQIVEPITVKIAEVKKAAPVQVPVSAQLPKLVSEVAKKGKQGGAAVAQNLGFLSLLGRKDLKKAIGGAPTALNEASPGAGPGGKQGSGGELLVGLGEGVKKTTVGNTGVAGLGGIGTKGAGGGAGGYGNSWVGSGGTGNGLNGIGNGRSLSVQTLSQDIVLEGGLDTAVIQATIAKYLSQVRACYEEGLRGNPGLTGQVTMAFEIGARGSLNYSKVARSSLGNSLVEQCISGKMMGWQFPEPLGGVNVKVSYPFLLRPVNS